MKNATGIKKSGNHDGKKILKGFTILIVAAAIVSSQGSCKKGAGPESAISIRHLTGDVKILGTGGRKTAAPGDALGLGDSLSAARSSLADIAFGSKGIIRVFENTEVKIALLAEQFEGENEFQLSKGKLYVLLSKLGKESRFKVKTPTCVIAVRGTSFRISVQEKTSRLDVLNGSVNVIPVSEGKTVEAAARVVEKNQSVFVSDQDARKELEGKKAITVVPLSEQDAKSIREEASGVKPEIIEKLDEAAKKEYREEPSGKTAVPPEKTGDQAVAAPVLKTEAQIKNYYNKLERISLDDGSVLLGAIIKQDAVNVKIHTVNGVITVPRSSVVGVVMQ